MSEYQAMSPGRIRDMLATRGLGDLGDFLMRRLQQLEYMQGLAINQASRIKELEALLPEKMAEERRQAEEQRLKAEGVYMPSAPAESDG
jgi:hypothetical protein